MRSPIVSLWINVCLIFILVLVLDIVGGIVLVQAAEQQTRPVSTPAPTSLPPAEPALVYARVVTGNVPIYQHPVQASQGISPTKRLETGYVWVSLASPRPVQQNQQRWYVINEDEYIQADYLEVYNPSKFQGIALSTPKRLAWIIFDTWSSARPGEPPGEDSLLLKRYTVLVVHETRLVKDRTWYRVGEQHWLEQGMVGVVTPKPRPEGVAPGDKWIEIDLYEQTLAAYQGDRLVYATLISSGLPWWKTEPGLFRIWLKVDRAKMSGREGKPDYYYLEDVPWTLYFNEEFALHGAYWHDRFGLAHSHGCVNLSLADSRWLFDWADPVGHRSWNLATKENPGTWVWVHEEIKIKDEP